jgi:hypothetical protein
MTPKECRRKLEEIASRVVDRLEREWSAEDAHFNDLGDLSERVSRETKREVTAELVRERSQCQLGNQSTCFHCHRPARCADYASCACTTLHGPFPVLRAYFHCAPCGQDHVPLDTAWGLGPAIQRPRCKPSSPTGLPILATCDCRPGCAACGSASPSASRPSSGSRSTPGRRSRGSRRESPLGPHVRWRSGGRRDPAHPQRRQRGARAWRMSRTGKPTAPGTGKPGCGRNTWAPSGAGKTWWRRSVAGWRCGT